jgi:hypothetical protein
MIRRNTWFLLILLAALIGFMVFVNKRKQAAATEPTPTGAVDVFLFGPEAGNPTRIKIEAAGGELVEVARDASGQWAITAPVDAPADQALVQAAADQIGAMTQLQEIEIELAAVGLDRPANVLTIAFSTGKQHRVAIGSKTVTDSGYYVRLDAETTTRIITTSSIEALLNLLKSPPYAQTPTPSPAPGSETPVSASETPTGTP